MSVSNEGLQPVEPRPGISPEAIWKIDAAILREEEFWLTEVYSLAIHSQDLIIHNRALQARMQSREDEVPVPRMNAFHNPEIIILNARNILSQAEQRTEKNRSYSPRSSAWAVLINTVAAYNLQLVDTVVETQTQLGIKNDFDRNLIRHAKIELTPEEELWLAEATSAQQRQIAAEKGYSFSSIVSRRNILRSQLGLVGKTAVAQA